MNLYDFLVFLTFKELEDEKWEQIRNEEEEDSYWFDLENDDDSLL